MTANPYQAPAAQVRDAPATDLPKHTRPLWLGVLVASFSPPTLVAIPLSVFLSIEPVGPAYLVDTVVMGLMVSAPAAVVVGWPLVLLLRWRGWLQGSTVCLIAVLAGAVVGGAMFSLPGSLFVDEEALIRGFLLGAASGLAAGLGMVLGAGIPLFRRAAGKAAG